MTRPVDLEEHARRRSAVRAGREAGEPTRAIADRLGLGHSTLYNWIRDYAPDLMSSLHTRSQLDEDECERRRDALDRAYYAGGMVADAAGELGLVTASLRSWMRRHMPTHPLATSDKRRTSAVPADPPPPMLRSEAILGAGLGFAGEAALADVAVHAPRLGHGVGGHAPGLRAQNGLGAQHRRGRISWDG